jgi:hypothetical protein
MRMVSLLIASGLVLASLSAAASRSCEILLAAPTQAGSVLLQPGQYRVSVDGSEAVFQEVRSARSFRTAVTVEDSPAEFEKTRILTSKNAGPRRVDAIEIEGSTTKIEF